MRWGHFARAGALALLGACSDAKTHVFSAQLYEQARGCLDDYAAIDVVEGGDGSARCAPACFVGGGAYYVSTMCAPFPAALAPADLDAAADPTCVAALAAAAAGKSCSAPVDAGDGRDAAGDAGDDGGDAGDDGGDADAPADAPGG